MGDWYSRLGGLKILPPIEVLNPVIPRNPMYDYLDKSILQDPGKFVDETNEQNNNDSVNADEEWDEDEELELSMEQLTIN